MIKHFLIFILYILTSFTALAEPSPFGLEINKITYDEVKQKYSGKDVGFNKYTGGKMFDINRSNIDIEGIKSIRAIFNENDVLLGIIATFGKNRYDSLLQSLSKNYKMISKKDAFVGDQHAKFLDHNTHIDISSPHMSFELTISYIHDDFEKLFLAKSDQEQKEKKKKEEDSL